MATKLSLPKILSLSLFADICRHLPVLGTEKLTKSGNYQKVFKIAEISSFEKYFPSQCIFYGKFQKSKAVCVSNLDTLESWNLRRLLFHLLLCVFFVRSFYFDNMRVYKHTQKHVWIHKFKKYFLFIELVTTSILNLCFFQ